MDNDFRVALIAGTSESVDYARHMRYKFKITAFCATEEGAHILEGTGCDCKVGRLDEEGFKQALWKYMVVCDASHPLAKQVSENVKNAGSEKEEVVITTIGKIDYNYIEKNCTVIIGNSQTYVKNKKMITPRGYMINGQ